MTYLWRSFEIITVDGLLFACFAGIFWCLKNFTGKSLPLVNSFLVMTTTLPLMWPINYLVDTFPQITYVITPGVLLFALILNLKDYYDE